MNSLFPKGVAEWKDAVLVWDLFLPMERQDTLSLGLIMGHLNLPCFRKWEMLPCIQKYTRRFKHSCFSFLISPLLLWSLILPVVHTHIVTTHLSQISGGNRLVFPFFSFSILFPPSFFPSFPPFFSTFFFSSLLSPLPFSPSSKNPVSSSKYRGFLYSLWKETGASWGDQRNSTSKRKKSWSEVN